MQPKPQIFVCIDGIDGVGKTAVSECIKREFNVPVIRGSYRWDGVPWPKEVKEVTDGFLMTTIKQLEAHIPHPIIFDRSTVSSAAYQKWNLGQVPWEEMYPIDKTLFVTMLGSPRVTIPREGLEPTIDLITKREYEQKRFLMVSDYLRRIGYKTLTVSPTTIEDAVTLIDSHAVMLQSEIRRG